MKIARLPSGNPEIFHTLQGEGVDAGVPAVFIRASLCNLHCVWCDTDYTWNWEGTPWPHERDGEEGYAKFRKAEQIIEMTPAEVAAAAAAFPCRHLVLTGGEPLLQEDAFVEVLEILRAADPDWTVEIETNGTLRPGDRCDALVGRYNVSPKLTNSGNADDLRLRPDAIAFFRDSPKAWFKFVVADPADLAEVEGLQALLALPPDRILVMPEARTPDGLAARSWVAEACLRHGYRFSDRLHLRLWGARRGV
ncbi:MAG: 7-carboxy-7-deazaguanine synthase QueE [Akkermansiaceae bacterium]|nr:7-carboxy-7-deazaguanine synthase QueE [Akkermansiaceae bacterium]NNM30556.1 7-carboxy-7-deazaguanine synthase QueE [Akkermansiaceae bacterium]